MGKKWERYADIGARYGWIMGMLWVRNKLSLSNVVDEIWVR